jgi:hypothetical protein
VGEIVIVITVVNIGSMITTHGIWEQPGSGSDCLCHHRGKHWLHDHQHRSSQVMGVIAFATIVGNIGSMITNIGAARYWE